MSENFKRHREWSSNSEPGPARLTSQVCPSGNRKRRHSAAFNELNCQNSDISATLPSFTSMQPASKRKRENSFNTSTKTLQEQYSDNDIPEILKQPDIYERYMIGCRLGEGMYGVVYSAYDRKTKLPVAIKIVNVMDLTWKRTWGGKMPMEVYLQRKLNHPNIVKAYHFTSHKTEVAIFMERPIGYMLLQDYLDQEKEKTGKAKLPESTAKIVFKQIADGVLHCLAKGVFHQDISTMNVLVNPNTLHAKIIDFGCASVVKPLGHYEITANDEATPPEFWNIKEWLDFSENETLSTEDEVTMAAQYPKPLCAYKTTSWACGAVLYEMVMGRDVYVDDGVYQVAVEGTSEGFQNVINKLLEEDPEARLKLSQVLLDEYFC